MKQLHHFNLNLDWELKSKPEDFKGRFYSKNHTLSFDQKSKLEVSAAKTFKGDPNLHNPEDLLLSSLTSCHMMSFLYCCSLEKIEVISYQDHSELILQVNADGSGKIIEAILRPNVKLKDQSKNFLLENLHQKAGKMCFIANSCNFPITYNPKL